MEWPEELIVGGTVKNRSRIIRRCDFFLGIMDNNLKELVKAMAHFCHDSSAMFINLKICNPGRSENNFDAVKLCSLGRKRFIVGQNPT